MNMLSLRFSLTSFCDQAVKNVVDPFKFGAAGLLGAILLASCGGGGAGSANGGQKPDPVVVDYPVAYIERTVPSYDPEKKKAVDPFENVMNPTAFFPGARVMVKERATALASVVDITADVFADDPNYDPNVLAKGYDVKDLAVNADGTKLLFAMRAPFDPKAKKGMGPKWHIYEYDLKTKQTPRPIITSKIVADQGDDVSPQYLPDGRILFASTRQIRSKAVLLDDGKPQFSALEEGGDMPAFVLHSMKDDGSDIQQLTYNQSHDLQPTVLQDGRILYSHWDQMGNHDNLSFYTSNPDGTNVQRHYGFLSLNQKPVVMTDPMVRLSHPQELADGRIAAILKPDGALYGGDMAVIDAKHFFENTLQVPAGGGTGTGQNPLTSLPISIKVGLGEVSIHGRFAGLAPLYDGTNRMLTSWSQCRLQETATKKIVACDSKLVTDGKITATGYTEAPPLFGLWIYNIADQSQLPVVLPTEGKMITNPISLEKKTPPTFYQANANPDLEKESVGMLHIRSVYDMDGVFFNYGATAFTSLDQIAQAAPDARPARFVRIIKAVSIPDKDTVDALSDDAYANLNGLGGIRGHLEILGYAPVEPDGSVYVKVPSDVAFRLEVLNKDGMRIGTIHNAWLQLRPGETRECNGCHLATNLTSGHGRKDAELASINKGAASGAPFTNTLRTDGLGTPMLPNAGETMGQFAARSTFCLDVSGVKTCYPMSNKAKNTNLRAPSVDLVFNDEWTDPAVRAKTASFAYRYSNLAPVITDIHSPTSTACMDPDGWSSLCRVIINYESHIQPLWERARPAGTANNACTGCHSDTGVDPMDPTKTKAQVPAAQLELVRVKGANNQPMRSYMQLFNGTNERFLVGGSLVPQIPVCTLDPNTDGIPICTPPPLDANGKPTCAGVANCQYELDLTTTTDLFDLALDSAGRVVPLTRAGATINAFLTRGSALANTRFFNKFTTVTTGTVNHQGMLNEAELKLLAEWLDLGGQYYSNPFALIEK